MIPHCCVVWFSDRSHPQHTTRTHSSTTFRARRSRSHVRSGTLRGPSRAWWSLASSAGHPTSHAPTLQSRTSTSTTNARIDVRCASRCCCSSGTCALSLVWLWSLVTSTKAVGRETASGDGVRGTSPMERFPPCQHHFALPATCPMSNMCT